MCFETENTNPIIKRVVVMCKMRLCSPALIGSGENELTDRDVYVDTCGKPILSGTSLTGILRRVLDYEDAQTLFGKLIDSDEDMSNISPLWVFDAHLTRKESDEAAEIITIDNVSLDENQRNVQVEKRKQPLELDHMNKVAKSGGKFDYQAIERGSRFNLKLQLIIRKDDTAPLNDLLGKLMSRINSLYVGGKTSRGFGKLECTDIYRREFDSNPVGLDAWLGFKWADIEQQEPEIPVNASSSGTIQAVLTLDSTLLIRDDYSVVGDEDTAQITSDGIPVIYGTSWAGAIRGGLARFLKTHGYKNCESYLDEVFGCDKYDSVLLKQTTLPSKIRIDASYFGDDIRCDRRHNTTRVKIDRWTGGAVTSKRALFTTRPQFGGTVTLTVYYQENETSIRELFVLALQAIDLGLVTVGGETSIGRGVFCVSEIYIDGDIQDDKSALYKTTKGELMTCL